MNYTEELVKEVADSNASLYNYAAGLTKPDIELNELVLNQTEAIRRLALKLESYFYYKAPIELPMYKDLSQLALFN